MEEPVTETLMEEEPRVMPQWSAQAEPEGRPTEGDATEPIPTLVMGEKWRPRWSQGAKDPG